MKENPVFFFFQSDFARPTLAVAPAFLATGTATATMAYVGKVAGSTVFVNRYGCPTVDVQQR
jgi:hypothetical protein